MIEKASVTCPSYVFQKSLIDSLDTPPPLLVAENLFHEKPGEIVVDVMKIEVVEEEVYVRSPAAEAAVWKGDRWFYEIANFLILYRRSSCCCSFVARISAQLVGHKELIEEVAVHELAELFVHFLENPVISEHFRMCSCCRIGHVSYLRSRGNDRHVP